MTEQELRGLDGPALTSEAFRLGLAPENVVPYKTPSLSQELFLGFWIGQDHFERWAPDCNLAQAHAVFRQLRARNLSCYTEAWGDNGNGQIEVHSQRPGVVLVRQPYGPGFAIVSEAHALLLCAVLAVSIEEPLT